MGAKLVAEEGLLKGLVLSLDKGDQWVIGRDPDSCQLLIEDPSASRKHALVRTTQEGIVLENLSSTNPVQINDQEIKEPQLLKNGDAVKLGSGTFRFYTDAAADTATEEKGTEEPNGTPQEILPPPTPQEEAHPPDLTAEAEQPQKSLFEEESDADKAALAEINFDLTETGRWLLKVVGGPNNGAEYSMQTGNVYLVGTDPNSCDIVFHDGSVSRQHARIAIGEDDSIAIEDLKSRNGTVVEGVPVAGKQKLNPNSIVGMGTTSFVVYDREGEMQTIISPLLPSIVKVLQQEEAKQSEADAKAAEQQKIAEEAVAAGALVKPPEKHAHLGAFLLIGILAGLIGIIGFGVASLMKSEPVVVQEHVDANAALKKALASYPDVKYQFNPATGRLNLVGHVLTQSDKNELLFNLQNYKFITSIDDKDVVIDEGVAREINQVLARNPEWKGITIQTPSPGHFMLTGYLQSRKQAEQIWDYISNNFPYLDLLQKRMVVEEEVISSVNQVLQNAGIRDINAQISNGDLTLTGNVATGKLTELNQVIPKLKEIQGVRNIKNFVTELPPEQSMVNISDRYEVTGVAQKGGVNMNVVINGRVLARGDSLDGMVITSIRPNAVFLEKDGIKYRIDYSR